MHHHPKNGKKDKGICGPEEPAEIPYTHKLTDKITNDTTDNKQGANSSGN